MTSFDSLGDFRQEIRSRIDEQRLDLAARASVNMSGERSAADLAEATRLARLLNSPMAPVLADMEQARKRARDRELASPQFQRDFPTLSKKLGDDFRFATMARDDLGNLKSTEGLLDWIGRSFELSAFNIGESLRATAGRYLGTPQTDEYTKRHYRELAQIAGERDEDNWGADAINVLTSLAAIGGAGAAGFALAGPAGAVTAATSLSYAMSSGEIYKELRDQGYTDAQAGPLADGWGAVMAALDLVGAGRVTSAFSKRVKDLLPGLLRRGLPLETRQRMLLGAVKDYALDIGVESVTEVLQQAASIAARLQARSMYPGVSSAEVDVGQELWDTFVHTARGMTLVGIPGAGRGIYQGYRNAGRAEQTVQAHMRIEALERESKMRTLSPEDRASFVNEAAPEEVRTVYIRPDKLLETLDRLEQDPETEGAREQLEAAAPGILQQARDAVANGTNVEVPIGVWLAKISLSKTGRELMPHAVFHQDADTAAEREALAPIEKDLDQAAVAEAAERAEKDDEFRQLLSEVYDTYYEQAVNVGRPADEARAFASLTRNVLVTLAKAEGIELADYLARENVLSIEKMDSALGITPDQLFDQDKLEQLGDEDVPTVSDDTEPGTLVRSEEHPNARGIYIGKTPGGSHWVAWRKNLGEGGAPLDPALGDVQSLEDWAESANNLTRRLAFMRARVNTPGLRARDRFNQDEPEIPDPKVDLSYEGTAGRMATGEKFKTRRDYKVAVHELPSSKAARAMGEEELAQHILDVGLRDARFALRHSPNAVGWYDDRVQKAMQVFALMHPEILTDERARLRFVWAVAVTSNGLKVDENFQLADEAYRAWKAHGSFESVQGRGTAKKAIESGLRLYDKLRADWGEQKLLRFMLTKFKVSEISALGEGVKISGELADQTVYGAAILGPKIGNGFFMNLFGVFDQLTMDRWLIRTWGRWTGTLLKDQPEQTAAARENLREALKAATDDDVARFAAQLGIDLSLPEEAPGVLPPAIADVTKAQQTADFEANPNPEAVVVGVRVRALREGVYQFKDNRGLEGSFIQLKDGSIVTDSAYTTPEGSGKGLYRQLLGRLANAFGSVSSSATLSEDAVAAWESVGAVRSGESFTLEGHTLDGLAHALRKASTKKENRDKVMDVTDTGADIRRGGNRLWGYLDGQKEDPATGGERKFIRESFGRILLVLRAEDPQFSNLTMADLQAALWYAEKRHYEDATANTDGEVEAYEDDEAPDYANAAASLARRNGVDEAKITGRFKAVEGGERIELTNASVWGAASGAPGPLDAGAKFRFNAHHVMVGLRRQALTKKGYTHEAASIAEAKTRARMRWHRAGDGSPDAETFVVADMLLEPGKVLGSRLKAIGAPDPVPVFEFTNTRVVGSTPAYLESEIEKRGGFVDQGEARRIGLARGGRLFIGVTHEDMAAQFPKRDVSGRGAFKFRIGLDGELFSVAWTDPKQLPQLMDAAVRAGARFVRHYDREVLEAAAAAGAVPIATVSEFNPVYGDRATALDRALTNGQRPDHTQSTGPQFVGMVFMPDAEAMLPDQLTDLVDFEPDEGGHSALRRELRNYASRNDKPSVAQPKQLIVSHTMGEGVLEEVLQFDLPLIAPSLAVTRANMPHQWTGAVRLVGHAEMLGNDTFDSDVYSGRIPFELRLKEVMRDLESFNANLSDDLVSLFAQVIGEANSLMSLRELAALALGDSLPLVITAPPTGDLTAERIAEVNRKTVTQFLKDHVLESHQASTKWRDMARALPGLIPSLTAGKHVSHVVGANPVILKAAEDAGLFEIDEVVSELFEPNKKSLSVEYRASNLKTYLNRITDIYQADADKNSLTWMKLRDVAQKLVDSGHAEMLAGLEAGQGLAALKNFAPGKKLVETYNVYAVLMGLMRAMGGVRAAPKDAFGGESTAFREQVTSKFFELFVAETKLRAKLTRGPRQGGWIDADPDSLFEAYREALQLDGDDPRAQEGISFPGQIEGVAQQRGAIGRRLAAVKVPQAARSLRAPVSARRHQEGAHEHTKALENLLRDDGVQLKSLSKRHTVAWISHLIDDRHAEMGLTDEADVTLDDVDQLFARVAAQEITPEQLDRIEKRHPLLTDSVPGGVLKQIHMLAIELENVAPAIRTKELFAEYLTALRTASEEYYEAKPLRMVPLSEFRGAVVDEGVEDETVQKLEAKGLVVVRGETMSALGTFDLLDALDAKAAKLQGEARQSMKDAVAERGSKPLTKKEVDAIKVDPPEILFEEDVNDRDKTPRGAFIPRLNKILISDKADSSTLFHELGHFYLEEMTRIAHQQGEGSTAWAIIEAVIRWGGLSDMQQWFSWSIDQRRELHEAFAMSFEKWLYEGVAPSEDLRDTFSKTRSWMTGVYTDVIQKLNRNYRDKFKKNMPGLTDEIRLVFGTMVATEADALAASDAAEFEVLFESEAEFVAAGGTPERYAELQAQHKRAEDRTVDELTRRRLQRMRLTEGAVRGHLKKLQRESTARRKEIRAEVEPRHRNSRHERARSFLRNGEHLDESGELVSTIGKNTSHKLNRGAVAQRLEPAEVRKLEEANALANNGLDPDTVASMFGFEGADTLLRTLVTEPDLGTAVKQEVDRRMAEEHPELTDPKLIREQVAEATHNSVRKMIVAEELNLLDQDPKPARMQLKAAKNVAARKVRAMQAKDVTPYKFALAARRARRDARTAVKKGDLPAAREAKRREMMAEAMHDAAVKFREERAKELKLWRKAMRNDKRLKATRDMNVIAVLRSLLATIDGVPGDADALLKQVSEYAPEVVEMLTPRLNRARRLLAEKAPLRQKPTDQLIDLMTVDEFREMAFLAKELWHLSKKIREIRLEGQRMLREAAAEQAVEDLATAVEEKPELGKEQAVTWIEEKVLGPIRDYWLQIRRVEHLFDKLGGIFPKLFQRVKGAALAKRDELRTLAAEVEADLSELDLPDTGTVTASQLGYTFGKGKTTAKAEIIGMALHFYGNESNRAKLLGGYGWQEAHVAAFLDEMQERGVLTEKDILYIQRVYDRNQSLLQRAQKAHYKAYGFYFAVIEPTPFETRYGTFSGGYVPAKVDPLKVGKATKHEIDDRAEFLRSMPVYARGFTETRVEGYTEKLDFDIGNQVAHLDSVLNMIHMHEAVRDVTAILSNPKVDAVIRRDLGQTMPELVIMPWLQRAVSQRISAPRDGVIGKMVDWLARRSQMAIMFGNIVNALQNYTGFGPIARDVPMRYLARAAGRYLTGNHRAMAREASSMSLEMAERLERQIFETRDQINSFLVGDKPMQKVRRGAQWVQRQTYILQTITQSHVDVIGFHAAHAYFLELELAVDGASPEQAMKRATERAEKLIRETQMAGNPEDVSTFESLGGLWRAVAPFKSWFVNWLNRLVTQHHLDMQKEGVDRVAAIMATYVYNVFVPAVLASLISEGLRGDLDADDDDEYLDDMPSFLARSHIDTIAGAFPVIGDAVRVASSTYLDDESWNNKMPTPPFLQLLEKMVTKPAALTDGVEFDEVVDVISLFGTLLGVPLDALGKRAKFLAKNEGGAGETLRGLLGGR